MSNNIVTQNTVLEDKLLLAPNKKFDAINTSSITLLDNTATQVSYVKIPFNLNGGQTLSVNHAIGKFNFLDRAVRLDMTIPIEIERETAAAVVPTADNFVATFLNNYNNICLRQYGLIQAIQSIEVRFDSSTISNITNLAECFESISEYYDEGEIDEHFQASQPDKFSNYDFYADSYPNSIQTLNLDGNKLYIPHKALANENIFNGSYTTRYNSRRPVLEFLYGTTTKASFLLRLYTYIPFSVFSLPTDETSLYGIDQLTMNINLKPDFVKRLFVINQEYKSDGATPPVIVPSKIIKDITFSNANATKHVASIDLKIYSAPSYVVDAIRGPTSISVKPYRCNLSNISMLNQPLIPATVTKSNIGFVLNDMQITAVPKAIYFSIHHNKDANILNTANFKGRLTSLNISYNNTTTNISDRMTLYNIAKSNGLQKDLETSLYTNGYVLKLDMSKDVGCGTDLLIGSDYASSLRINGTFDNISAEDTVGWEVRVVLVNEGSILYNNGHFSTEKSLVLQDTKFNNSNYLRELYDISPKLDVMIGGGIGSVLWGGIKNLAKKGFDYVQKNPEKVMKGLSSLGKTFMGGQGQYSMQNITGGSGVSFKSGGGNVSNLHFK